MEKKRKQHQSFRFAQQWRLLVLILSLISASQAHNYTDALSKSLLYFEAQRSGRLPHNQRVVWRDHSGLTDGLEQGVSGNKNTQLWKEMAFQFLVIIEVVFMVL